MFNRSIKYLVLVVINIVIITILIMGEDQTSDVFDTDYVISLLDDNKQLERKVEDLSVQNKYLESSGSDIQRQIMQTRALIDENVEKLNQCNADKEAYISLADKQASERRKLLTSNSFNAQECSDNAVQVSFLNKQMVSLKTQLSEATSAARDAKLENELLRNEIAKMSANSGEVDDEKKLLNETIQQLEQDLVSNIYIKQIYTTPVYCQPPRFESRVCVQRLLVRPQFSKKPFTDVQTTLTDPNGKIIGKFSFDSSKAKLVNFPFADNTEHLAGEYTVTFVVNAQTLVEKITLKH